MPGRLRRRGCLKPGQPRSASPSAWGPTNPPRSRSPRRSAVSARHCANLPERTYLFVWPTRILEQLLRRSQNGASTSQRPVQSGRFQVATEQEQAIKSIPVG